MVGRTLTFRDQDWNRLEADDGVLGWKVFNERWDSKSSQWYSPVEFGNYLESMFYTKEYSTLFRYVTMLYYSLINLGLGEIAPVNFLECLFLTLAMVLSALVFTNIFSEIAMIYA